MSSSDGGKKPASGGRGGPTIRTLADINRGSSGFPGGGSGGGGSDEDEPQEYYTGGEKSNVNATHGSDRSAMSELKLQLAIATEVIRLFDMAMEFRNLSPQEMALRRSLKIRILDLAAIESGMLVQDPTKRNDVDSIFEQARQMSALQGQQPPFDGQSSSSSFTGTGRLLSGETAPSAPRPPENILHNIFFWNNGFTVDDGPLRDYEDPENADFIESIKKSQCPQELEPLDRRTSVHVNVIKRSEDYEEPVKPPSPFQGVGRTLGGGSSADESAAPTPATQVPHTASRSLGIVVDDSLPFTSIQLRLADGTRMVTRFNMHHTVGDVRSFIDASRPGGGRPYQLQTGFPPKQLTDLTQTIEQAGLANSVIIQKM